jgi:hypothetical protein
MAVYQGSALAELLLDSLFFVHQSMTHYLQLHAGHLHYRGQCPHQLSALVGGITSTPCVACQQCMHQVNVMDSNMKDIASVHVDFVDRQDCWR